MLTKTRCLGCFIKGEAFYYDKDGNRHLNCETCKDRNYVNVMCRYCKYYNCVWCNSSRTFYCSREGEAYPLECQADCKDFKPSKKENR